MTKADRLLVRPRAGLIVRDPLTLRALPEEGGTVPRTSFWLRRVFCGDVVLIKEPEQEKEPDAEL